MGVGVPSLFSNTVGLTDEQEGSHCGVTGGLKAASAAFPLSSKAINMTLTTLWILTCLYSELAF